jgi:TIGR02453 family protein
MTFNGFSPETFWFFEELEKYNYKPWFEEHKAIYQSEVLQPLKDFAVSMTPFFYQLDPLMEFRPNKMISRIYRDIRFSNDKTPYKKHMWIMFQRPFTKHGDEWTNFPGYYLEIGKEGANFGMGLFMGKKKTMDLYRDRIAYDPVSFREMTEGLREKHGFILGGEEYKRPLVNDLSEYFQPWMQRKGIYLTKNIPISEVFHSVDFIPFMENEFAYLHPFYEFLVDICD